MNYLKTLRDMFDRANIDYTEERTSATQILRVERGYPGFEIEFEFDFDGNLLDIGAYE